MRDLLSRLTARAVERAWQEAARFEPQTVSEYGGASPDATRPVRADVPVVRSRQDQDGRLAGQRRGSEFQGSIVSSSQTERLFLTAETYAGLGYALRVNDHVVLTDRPGAPRMRVVNVNEQDAGDTTIHLAAL